MARKFAELLEKMPADSRARIAASVAKMQDEMALTDLRSALNITQEQLAKKLDVKQAAVSKIERRADMFVSTLAAVIAGMGGELEIHANFPQGRVRITQFAIPKPKKGGKKAGRKKVG